MQVEGGLVAGLSRCSEVRWWTQRRNDLFQRAGTARPIAATRRRASWLLCRGPLDLVARLLITADGGGSNGYRTRLWKTELAELAAQTGLTITVCHLPPGTSKWNKIEHRLFSHISMNWRGRPLTSNDVIVAATTTRTGLTVHAELDTGTYPTGIKIPDAQTKALHETGALPPRMAPRMELHPQPARKLSVLIIGKP
jgi:hypothetical protein